MILTALKELAEREGLLEDPDYEPKLVSWVIELDHSGKWLGYTDIRQPDRKGKPMAVKMAVPKTSGRTSGVSAQFLYDKSDYVLGFKAGKSGQVETSDKQLDACIELHDRAASESKDEGLQAVVRFLKHQKTLSDRSINVPEDFGGNDWFVFRLKGDEGYVHNREKVREWWQKKRSRGSDQATAECLVTGKPCIPVDKHDLIKKVPGGSTSGVGIVTFNSGAFESYGFDRNLNAPVSREAAEAYVRALNRLLDRDYPDPEKSGQALPQRHIRVSKDTAVAFWTADPKDSFADDAFAFLNEPDPVKVRDLVNAPRSGRPLPELKENGRFYALTISGAQGRATIRDWFTTSVGEMHGRLRQWFEDLELETGGSDGVPPSILNLLRSLVLQGKDENIPPNLAAELFRAVLSGGPLPATMLQAAIRRCKAEGVMSSDSGGWKRAHLRMQTVKAVLVRQRRLTENHNIPEVKPMLDESITDPAYLCGRLFAVLERIQWRALKKTNTTIGSRYYGRASTAPATVFPTLIRLSKHHTAKISQDSGNLANFYEGLKGKIIRELKVNPVTLEGWPKIFTLDEQGLFAIGYYHQKQYRKSDVEGTDDPEAPEISTETK